MIGDETWSYPPWNIAPDKMVSLKRSRDVFHPFFGGYVPRISWTSKFMSPACQLAKCPPFYWGLLASSSWSWFLGWLKLIPYESRTGCWIGPLIIIYDNPHIHVENVRPLKNTLNNQPRGPVFRGSYDDSINISNKPSHGDPPDLDLLTWDPTRPMKPKAPPEKSPKLPYDAAYPPGKLTWQWKIPMIQWEIHLQSRCIFPASFC